MTESRLALRKGTARYATAIRESKRTKPILDSRGRWLRATRRTPATLPSAAGRARSPAEENESSVLRSEEIHGVRREGRGKKNGKGK
jgi:hypothetical protein